MTIASGDVTHCNCQQIFAISYASLVGIETVNGCTRMTDMNPLLTVRITSSTVFAPLMTAMEASSTAARHAR